MNETQPPPDKHGVVAVLQDGSGHYLVIRRGLTLVRAPGWWCFPGGEVERGESFAQAIEREVLEEIGVRVTAVRQIHETVTRNNEYHLHWFRVEPNGPLGEFQPHAVEVAEVRWLSVAEILATPDVLPGLVDWLSNPNQSI